MKLNVKIELLYQLCRGDINLAVEIIKNNQFLKLINLFIDKQFNKILDLMENINLNYNFSIDNDFYTFEYNDINATISNNNLVTKFNFIEENTLVI